MIERIIEFSLRQRLLVLLLCVILIGFGIWSAYKLPIDAVPDITTNQVQINTSVPALAPFEVEKLVTYPIETSMGGVPYVQEVRSLSRYGLSQVTVVFQDSVDIYFARQLVLERLQSAKEEIPAGLGAPTMGPIATGLGEIYLYTLDSEKYDPMELRTMQDWIIKPALRTTQGVAEVNSVGGFEKSYQVIPDPQKLLFYGLTLREVFEALAHNNANAGGSYIEHNEEHYLVRGIGLVKTLDDIGNIVVGEKEGVPIYVKNLADVKVGPEIRTGVATRDGKETVQGTALLLKGENSRTVATRVREKLREIQKTLPPAVKINPIYDRTVLVDKTIHTVKKNLFEGGVLVIAILLMMLGNLRAGLIVASAIPLSMLFALIGMVATKTSGNLMSLGAIDFGLIVDGAVVMVENIIRRLSERKKCKEISITSHVYRTEILNAAREVARPVVFAIFIITVVYLPILTLQGVEGKMFRPMALTVVMALVGSLILTLTLIPVLCSFFLGREISEKETRLFHWVRVRYERALGWAMQNQKRIIIYSIFLVVMSFLIFPFLGSEFIPKLDEESLAMETIKPNSISLSDSVKYTKELERILLGFPEVSTVSSRIGTAEIATDPTGFNRADIYLMLKKKVPHKEKLIEKMQKALSVIPGTIFGFSQPIELRVNELIAGVRSDIAVKIFGDDLDVLKSEADKIQKILSTIRGAQDVRAEQIGGLPVLQVEIDRAKIARYGINVEDVLSVIEMAVGGKAAGQVYEGVKRFNLIVRYPENYRNSPEAIGNILISSPTGQKIPLAQLTQKIAIEEGPAQINHDNTRRRIAVEANVRGRDLGSFVDEAKQKIEKQVKLPPSYSIEWGGQFRNLKEARERLLIVIPVSLFLILILLFGAFNSLKQALLVFTGIPLAITGGVFALLIRGIHFSISAAVGFIALFGVAMLNGVVMVSYINQLRQEGKSLEDAVMQGAQTRLRPVLMTALVASLGFIPMALAQGTGAEVQRPLATVVIGGLISSTLLTLLVLPVLYIWFERKIKA